MVQYKKFYFLIQKCRTVLHTQKLRKIDKSTYSATLFSEENFVTNEGELSAIVWALKILK